MEILLKMLIILERFIIFLNSYNNKSILDLILSILYRVQINSLMPGGRIVSEPSAVVGLIDAIKCARNLLANVILLDLLYAVFTVQTMSINV